jgi:hypothetical protein
LAQWEVVSSYSATAPEFTGFLAPIHFSKLAKNQTENYGLRFEVRLFNHLPTRAVMSSEVETSLAINQRFLDFARMTTTLHSKLYLTMALSSPNFVITGGAGSSDQLRLRCRKNFRTRVSP